MSITEVLRSYSVLDAQGRHTNGTDKQSNHNYGPAYEKLFANLKVELLLEVGVAGGACLLAWREIFPGAKIVGLDIHSCAANGLNNLELHEGDQRSKADCERAANGRLFDIIIEDAYHSTENTLLTLFWLWPSVKPGGLYIVEEWADIGNCRENILALWPNTEIISTDGPFGGDEPIVVLRKKQ